MIDIIALAAVRRGDEEALRQIIQKYTPYVSAIIRNMTGLGMEDIEEVSADVFLALWQNADKPNPLKLKAYLGAIARNKAKNKLRQTHFNLPLEENMIVIPEDSLINALNEEEERRAVKRAVYSMKNPDREIFLRHYYFMQPVARIASEMNMGQSAIKHRLQRGREKLKNILGEVK